LSPWLTVLTVLLALVAVVLVGRDAYHHADARRSAASSPAPEPVVTRVAPPPAPATTDGGAPAASGEEEVPEVEPPEQPEQKPIVRVRDGQRVALHSSPGGKVVAEVGDETSFGSRTAFAVNRSRQDWLGVPSEEVPNGKLAWVKADPDELRGDYTPYRIVVDLSAHDARLYDGDRAVREWAVTIGTAATPTPTGRFSVTDLIEGGLNPVYGCCAIAISATQPYLPAGWTGGDRIAFHGTTGPLGVDASNGCIRSPDDDLRAVIKTVPLGTPVRIKS